jgi:hypothetical protein
MPSGVATECVSRIPLDPHEKIWGRMTDPDLTISPEAIEHVRQAIDAWTGNSRDLALALTTMGHAALLILDGRSDHIALYERAARTVDHFAKPQGAA